MSNLLGDFFYNTKGEMPSFIESVDEYPHLKIVKLKGWLDHTTVPEVQFYLKKAKKNRGVLNKNVLLDLKNVASVDTAAIAGLLQVLSELKQKNYKLGLMNVPETMRDHLKILKLDEIFLVFESENKAFREILAWSEGWQ